MNNILTRQILLALVFCMSSAFAYLHDYYVSVTHISYSTNNKKVNIEIKMFLNDFESALRSSYNKSFKFEGENESEDLNLYIEQYLQNKLTFKIDNRPVAFTYIKNTYSNDIIKCFLELDNIDAISSLEVTNKVMLDLIFEQQNIIKTDIYNTKKNIILHVNEPTHRFDY